MVLMSGVVWTSGMPGFVACLLAFGARGVLAYDFRAMQFVCGGSHVFCGFCDHFWLVDFFLLSTVGL